MSKSTKTVRILSFVLVAFFVLIPSAAIAQDRYVPQPKEEIYGTWTNEKNIVSWVHPQKIVISQDTMEVYEKLASSLPPDKVIWSIVDRWTDSEGNVWYKANGTGTSGAKGYKWEELYKLSKNATILERAFVALPFGSDFDPSQYPTQIDPNDYVGYTIWYRAEQ